MNPTINPAMKPAVFRQARTPQFQGYQIVVGKEKQLDSLAQKLRKLSAEQGFQLALDETAIARTTAVPALATPKATTLASLIKQLVALAKQSTEALKPKPNTTVEALLDATAEATASLVPALKTVTSPETEALNATILKALSELIKDLSGLSVKPDDLKKWGEPGGPQVMVVYTGADAAAYENNQAVLLPILKAISAALTKASELFAENVGKLNDALGVEDPRRKQLIPRLLKGSLMGALPTLIAALPPELQDVEGLNAKLEALQKDTDVEKALEPLLIDIGLAVAKAKGDSIPADAPASLTPAQVKSQVSAVLTLAAGKLGLPEAYATAVETSLSGPLNIAGDLLQTVKDPLNLPKLLSNRPRPVTVPRMYSALRKPVVTAAGAPLVSTKPIRLNLEAFLTVIGGALKAGRDASQNYGIKLTFKPKAYQYPPQVVQLARQLGITPAEAAKLFAPK
ncbi:MAG: hypothetical protein K2X01_04760 [Cyanobacteria bacterium]|nr:hypothetical protein [Cyanobacteriota bacterium]